tara:strand:+ start:816 stop:1169 length:354 start_codon:yes stop_codon:yes gene_type:complete
MKLNMSFEFSTLEEARAVISQFVNVEGDVDKMINDTMMHADAQQKQQDEAQVQTVPVADNAVTHASLREVLTELKDIEGIESITDLLAGYGAQSVTQVSEGNLRMVYAAALARLQTA